jgi:ABC-type dipeptide/oligopeptide/nickel transport system ATPase component
MTARRLLCLTALCLAGVAVTANPVDIPAGCRFRPHCAVGDDACMAVDPHLEPPQGHRAACIKL